VLLHVLEPAGPGERSEGRRREAATLVTICIVAQPVRQRMASSGLVRPRQGRVVAGLLAGVARGFGVSAALVRVLFVLSMLLPGPQILAYIGSAS
jgi:phage shock protein PspC (stress-responsive transcriptional regulator)